uniref:(northern house mosquito) hypothetical protein n=1 Tax=Culex pipiens TaxID=7175 RepID=A0A8D8A2J4_CULPI
MPQKKTSSSRRKSQQRRLSPSEENPFAFRWIFCGLSCFYLLNFVLISRGSNELNTGIVRLGLITRESKRRNGANQGWDRAGAGCRAAGMLYDRARILRARGGSGRVPQGAED